MPFANPLMLIGLLAVSIPILIHLLNRRKARDIHWGAMQFLLGSVVSRNRRMLLEEALLLALRCLLLALLALAMALPFIPPGSSVPWQIVMPALLLGAAALGAGAALWSYRLWRWVLCGAGTLLLLLAVGFGMAESLFQVRLWARAAGEQDVAIVIDASASMTIEVDGKTNFERAVEEALTVVASLGPNDAVSIILAGPRPLVIIASPIVQRDRLRQLLSELRPIGGPMAVHDALGAAAITLAEGQNPGKKVVLITDAQSVGWKTDGEIDWEFLGEAFKEMTVQPRLVLRTLPMPPRFRNVQVTAVTLGRRIIGPDREAAIHVRVENTGSATITSPFDIELRVDGEKDAPAQSVIRLDPGSAETVTFRHWFEHGGLHTIEAKAVFEDDLMSDNTAARVIATLHRLPVLVVEGNPSPRLTDRAGAFLSIALMPDPDDDVFELEDEPKKKRPRRELVELTQVGAPDAGNVRNFSDYRAVILAGVPRLPADVAARLAQFVVNGGGLLIVTGERSVPEFYNEWRTLRGELVSPARLIERRVRSGAGEAASPAASTFRHPALRVVAENPQSDIGAAAVTAYWRIEVDALDETAAVSGSLDSGDPFVTERRLGGGRVLMTAVSLDNRGSNLRTLQAFVPLVHELVYHLVRLPAAGPEFEPANRLIFPLVGLDARRDAPAELELPGQGLRGDYFADPWFDKHVLTRVDGTVHFGWGGGAPAPGIPRDRHSVRWTGSVVPPKTGPYTFHLCGDDRSELWIDGKSVVAADKGATRTGKVMLTAGRRHAVRIEHADGAGASTCRVWWSGPGIGQQPVPQNYLSPNGAWTSELSKGLTAELEPPSGPKRPVAIEMRDEQVIVRADRVAHPGLYRVALPFAMADSFRDMAVNETVPFSIRGRPEESHLSVLSETDLDGAAEHIELFAARSTNDMIRALTSGVPGQRLWKYLAAAALAAALLEVALAQWIARQRKIGATRVVDFTSATTDTQAFRARFISSLDAGRDK